MRLIGAYARKRCSDYPPYTNTSLIMHAKPSGLYASCPRANPDPGEQDENPHSE